MADKKIFIADGPKKGNTPRSPFDLTYTNNNTGKFGQVQCTMMKYYPAGTKLKITPSFVYDLMPFVYPIQTNVRCHVELYKVPLRILWDKWEDFCCQLGTNGTPVNSGATPFVPPYIKKPTGWNGKGSLAEQLNVSNHKFSEVSNFVYLNLDRIQGNVVNNIFVPRSGFSGGFCVRFKLPSNSFLSKISDGTFQGRTFTFSWVDNSNSIPNNITGGIKFSLFKKTIETSSEFVSAGYDDINEFERYTRLYEGNEITNFVGTSNQFNNSTSPCIFLVSSISRVYNGIQLYEHNIVVKVSDAFLSAYKSLAASAYDLYVFVNFSGSLLNLIYQNGQDLSSFKIVKVDIPHTTEVKPDTGQVTQSDVSNTLVNSLGLNTSVYAAVTSITDDYHTFFDSVNGADPVQPVSALPFRALEFIHNYFKRKPRIDPFYKDGVPSYNEFLTNTGSGADSTTPTDTWNAFFEDDYFTTCVKEPQFGNAPLVGVTVNDTSDKGVLRFSDGTAYNNYSVELDIDQDGHVLPLTAYDDTADRPNVHRLRELINFGISIADLRNVSTFQRMLERMQRAVTSGGSPYKNYMYEFFGTNPPIGDHYPQYLGGVTRSISVDKITNVALSEHSKLGEFAGQGRIKGQGKSIKTFLTEPSFIVAIQYFTVTPVYSQYTPKFMFYKDPLDFYLNSDFATVSPQPVFKKEIALSQMQSNELNDVFGYNRPYAELVSNVDEVHGEFKYSMANYLLQRIFGSAPNLNKSFIEINPNDLLNIFSVVDNTDKIFGQCMFEIHGSLPLPRSYTPHTI